MTTTTSAKMTGSRMEERRCFFGVAKLATKEAIEFDSSTVVAWGLRRVYGRGGTATLARLADGTQVEIARSKQTKEAARILNAIAKRIGFVPTPSPIAEKWIDA